MRALRVATLGLGLLATAAGADPPAADAALQYLRARAPTLCLEPLTSEVEVTEWSTRRAWIEQFLASRLEASGFTVVPSARTRELAKRLDGEAGGTFDPLTGAHDAAKAAALRAQLRAKAAQELGCRALLDSRIEHGSAPFANGFVRWDHVEHRVPNKTGGMGWLATLSLHLAIVASDGTTLFERWAGIHPTVELRDYDFARLPKEKLLAEPRWNARAVLAGLGDLAPPLGDALLPCLREAFGRLGNRESSRRTVGIAYLARWTAKLQPGIDSRAACEAAAFQFVPPPPGEDEGLPSGAPPGLRDADEPAAGAAPAQVAAPPEARVPE